MPKDLKVHISKLSGAAIVTLIGEAHHELTDIYPQVVLEMGAVPKVVVIDGTGLTFVGSVGMRWLLNLRRDTIQGGGQLRIAALDPMIQTAMGHARLLGMFELFPDVASALVAPSGETNDWIATDG